mgnify:CR=1 FL=1
MIQRIALYSTMGLLLQALGHTWDTWQFWSMLSLFWASERLTKQEQHEQSYVQGILMYIALEPQQQQELAQAIQQVEHNHND